MADYYEHSDEPSGSINAGNFRPTVQQFKEDLQPCSLLLQSVTSHLSCQSN
jgi:cell fate (sporulation/competence/biofilm development) regulator YmcA (YheA/YmcA/DUF963 family)